MDVVQFFASRAFFSRLSAGSNLGLILTDFQCWPSLVEGVWKYWCIVLARPWSLVMEKVANSVINE